MSLKAEMDPAKRRKRRVTSKRDVSELLLRDSRKHGETGLKQ